MRDYDYLSLAALESTKSDQQQRHGSVLVTNGKIRGRGCNSGRTQSCDGFINNTCSCHAEIAALRNAWHNCSEGHRSLNIRVKEPWV
tara:strand:- start:1528 stop:1788 length:261 start_codon:yes stop_codon:yes gene_type:complete